MWTMRRKIAGGTAIAVLAAFAVLPVLTGRADDEDDKVILAWETMAAEPSAAVNVAINTRGIVGGMLPWDITRAAGKLTVGGDLEVHVRGLILDEGGGPNNFVAGTNPFKTFGVIVSCLTVDPATNELVVANVTPINPKTGLPAQFHATVPTGNSDIHTHVSLPNPCIMPFVVVTSPTMTWIASTGVGN